MPAGGRGYTRGAFADQPVVHRAVPVEHTVGPFDSNPSVASRMKVFDASIEQMLWPDKRERDAVLGSKVARHDRPAPRSAAT